MTFSASTEPDGGAPLLGEPVAIEFGNTHYAVRGKVREGIGKPTHLTAWLRANAARLGLDPADPGLAAGVGEAEVGSFLALRDAIRGIADATVGDRPAAPADLRTLNDASAAAPRWPVLEATAAGGYQVAERTRGGAVTAALAAVAQDAVRVFGGPDRAQLRACQAPGCVLFFVKDHPRREWCSAGCGNRARAARHYLRHRAERR